MSGSRTRIVQDPSLIMTGLTIREPKIEKIEDQIRSERRLQLEDAILLTKDFPALYTLSLKDDFFFEENDLEISFFNFPIKGFQMFQMIDPLDLQGH
jgi:hypothetical protein